MDIPRPPLRTLALRTHWRTRQQLRDAHVALRRAAHRAYVRAARHVAHTIAYLDARVWQPALWPFRPAQREMLARAVAALSVAAVAVGWIAAYSALTPAQDARPPAPPPKPPKPFAERVVSRALPEVKPPIVEVPMPDPAPNRR